MKYLENGYQETLKVKKMLRAALHLMLDHQSYKVHIYKMPLVKTPSLTAQTELLSTTERERLGGLFFGKI